MTKHNKTTLPIYLESSKTRKLITKEPVHPKQHGDLEDPWEMKSKFKIIKKKFNVKGHEIAHNTGANATKFFTLATKSWKLVAKLATRILHHNLT